MDSKKTSVEEYGTKEGSTSSPIAPDVSSSPSPKQSPEKIGETIKVPQTKVSAHIFRSPLLNASSSKSKIKSFKNSSHFQILKQKQHRHKNNNNNKKKSKHDTSYEEASSDDEEDPVKPLPPPPPPKTKVFKNFQFIFPDQCGGRRSDNRRSKHSPKNTNAKSRC